MLCYYLMFNITSVLQLVRAEYPQTEQIRQKIRGKLGKFFCLAPVNRKGWLHHCPPPSYEILKSYVYMCQLCSTVPYSLHGRRGEHPWAHSYISVVHIRDQRNMKKGLFLKLKAKLEVKICLFTRKGVLSELY